MLVEDMRNLDKCDVKAFGRLESSDQTIASLGDRWPHAAKQDGDRIVNSFYVL